MTENPRLALLLRARRRTATIIMGSLAGTGLLTVAVAAVDQQAAGADTGTTSGTTSGATDGTTSSGSSDEGSTSTGSSGVGTGHSAGQADGGSNAS